MINQNSLTKTPPGTIQDRDSQHIVPAFAPLFLLGCWSSPVSALTGHVAGGLFCNGVIWFGVVALKSGRNMSMEKVVKYFQILLD
jgi:hypothetical protein